MPEKCWNIRKQKIGNFNHYFPFAKTFITRVILLTNCSIINPSNISRKGKYIDKYFFFSLFWNYLGNLQFMSTRCSNEKCLTKFHHRLQNIDRIRWVRWWPETRRCSVPFSATRNNTSDSTETVYRPVLRIDRRSCTRRRAQTRTRAPRRTSRARRKRLRPWKRRSERRASIARRAKSITRLRSTPISAIRSRSRIKTSVALASPWRRAGRRVTKTPDAASLNRVDFVLPPSLLSPPSTR